MDKEFHEQVVYPVVRVASGNVGGSGTIVYSKPNAAGVQETFLLTNHHVIGNAIHIREEWDPYLGRNRKKEYRDKVEASIFRYIYGSKRSAEQGFQAVVEAYHERSDLALVRLDDEEYVPQHIAKMFPKADNPWKEIHYKDKVIASGCSLGHPTVVTEGIITSMNDEIDNYDYWMSTAQTIFGNSGGAIFLARDDVPLADKYRFIGIPSRISVMGSMFSMDAITHMGYFIPIHRIYNFLENQMFQFIYDDKYTSEQCAEMREEKREQAEVAYERWRRGTVDSEETPVPEKDESQTWG